MPIKDEEMRTLCIAGEMTNGQLAEHFGVDATDIWAWRSSHGLTIAKCRAIREGKVKPGKRAQGEIEAEIKKVEGAKRDAERKFVRASDRLIELRKELKEVAGK